MARRAQLTTDTESVATLPEPASFDDIARARVRKHIAEYRELVAQAADGELGEKQLARVLDLLDHLRLPHAAWSLDVVSFREYRAAQKAEAEALARKPEIERRLAEVISRVRDLDEELRQLKAERYTLADVEPATRAQYARTCNERAAECPHLFFDIDDSVRRWLEAHNRPATASSISGTAGAWE